MNFCEAMVLINQRWTRCGVRPVELHHRITRARGGLILDAVGENYHLSYLCRRHHMIAHDQGNALQNGLLLDGYVTSSVDGPVYEGDDKYLTEKYGPR